MPVVSASITRRMCGIWVVDHIVNSSAAAIGATTTPRGSIGVGSRRCWRKRRRTTTASSPAAATGLGVVGAGAREVEQEAAVGALVAVHERRALGERDLHVDDGGQLVVLDRDRLERVGGGVAVAGHDDATPSPT
jgi:hypothetical protein